MNNCRCWKSKLNSNNSISYYNAQPCEDMWGKNLYSSKSNQRKELLMPRPIWFNQIDCSRFNQDSRFSFNAKALSRPLSPVSHSLNVKVNCKLNNKEEILSNNKESVDTESDVDSIDSHFDAIDEISEIFGSSPSNRFSPMIANSAPFQRPSNPIINDIQFSIPRNSAPRFSDLESEDSFELNDSFSPSSF